MIYNMKAKLYIILATLCVFYSCNKEPKITHLHCYALDMFHEKVLNTPYDVYYNDKSFLVKDGKDTIYFKVIDSISKSTISSNDNGLTFINTFLYYTDKGKYVSENSVCKINFSKTLISGTDTIIGYHFEDSSFGQKYHYFDCKEPMDLETYKSFITWITTH